MEFCEQFYKHIQNRQITLAPGTIRKTPSPNKQPLSRPGSAGGAPGTVHKKTKGKRDELHMQRDYG